jgi:hypothetical protein
LEDEPDVPQFRLGIPNRLSRAKRLGRLSPAVAGAFPVAVAADRQQGVTRMPLDKSQLDDVAEFLEDANKGWVAERLGDDIEDETERLSQFVELKELVQKAETAGLGDDPAVVAPRDRVATLSRMSDAVDDTRAILSAEHDIPESVVDQLNDDQAADLLEELDNYKTMESAPAGRLGGELVDASAEHHFESAKEILSNARVPRSRAAALAAGSGDTDDDDTPESDGREFAAAAADADTDTDAAERLAADHGVARQKIAALAPSTATELRDRLETLENVGGDDAGRLRSDIVEEQREEIVTLLAGTPVDVSDLPDIAGGGRR